MTPLNALLVRCRMVVLLAGVVIASTLPRPALADPETPTSQDRQIAFVVSRMLQNDHLTEHKIDDEISQRCLTTFLESLDPWKLYFRQSDIDRFAARDKELDDLITSRNLDEFLSFAHSVFATMLERVDQTAVMVDKILDGKLDFTVDEEILRDPDLATYAKTDAEARDKWRKLIKYDLLSLKVDDDEGAEGDEAVQKLRSRYESRFRRTHQTDREELLEIYLTALTSAFDPHTSYMSPDTLENFNIVMRLQLQGIGAALQSMDGETVVKKIIPGGAADKDGRLQVEDKIVGVGQGPEGEVEDVVNMKLKEVVRRIRGDKGTIVRLEIVPADGLERSTIDITRDKIELKDSEAQGEVFEEGKKADGQPYKLGVIELPSFYMDMDRARRQGDNFKSTTRDVRRILDGFNKDGVDAVVLDLRRNGGGSLQEAINLTGLFIDEGPVVQVKDSAGQVQSYHDLVPGYTWKGPLVVLISKFSASASEILAGAIQDYGRGLIVGDRATHGKGTVQSLMDLGLPLLGVRNTRNWGALKITMQQFYRPSGDSTQNRGVLADVELPSLSTHLDVGEADLDFPLPFDHVKPAKFKKLAYVDEALCDRLSSLSSRRRQDSNDFQRVLKNIDRYLERKERKSITLNEAKFMAEMEEINADKEEKDTIEKMSDSANEGIKRTYYLDEALAITLDYLKLTAADPPTDTTAQLGSR